MFGHLVIADISGYTRFLTDNELDHANGIISELLNAVIGSIQAPLQVSGIEGDAVFMYGTMPENTSGQSVLESVELLYTSFASALETMILNTTCTCNACANIKTLGMKIIMHCGEFAKSEIGGRETLSGPDVIMAHRLLKNQVVETTGIADYMLVTQACVDDLGVQQIVAGWTEHTEMYDDVGEVTGYVSSLPDVWAFVRQQNEEKVLQRDAWIAVNAHSQAPPMVVWDHLIDPFKRTAWLNAKDNLVSGETGGRIAPGANYHCAHGENDVTIFSVLDMKTMDYITFVMSLGNGIGLRYTDYLIPSGNGTRIVTYASSAFSIDTGDPLPHEVLTEMAEPLTDEYEEAVKRLAQMANEAAKTLTPA